MRFEVVNRQSLCPVDARRLARALSRVFGREFGAGAISVALTGDREIRELNRRFRRRDRATDVLSFPLEQPGDPFRGEVVVSLETARRESRRRRLAFEREALLYVIHGILHLCGHDDDAPGPRRLMARAQNRLLKRLPAGRSGIGRPERGALA